MNEPLSRVAAAAIVSSPVANTVASAAACVQPLMTETMRLYRWMYTARRVDALESELIARGEAFFHVSGAGHETTAALAPCLLPGDYLHCHYRDKALLLARGLPAREFFDSLLCNGASHSAGRQMSAHLSSPTLRILSIVGPVGNSALQAVGVAAQVRDDAERPIVLCSLGDGSTQQGEVMEAIAEAVRWQLPVLFLVHDNRLSISTRTPGQTFFSRPDGDASSFYGLPLHRIDGTRPPTCMAAFQALATTVRSTRAPAICVMAVERLTDHTNADDQRAYRSEAEIEGGREASDPVENLRRWLLSQGAAPRDLDRIHAEVEALLRAAMQAALDAPAPQGSGETSDDGLATRQQADVLTDHTAASLTMAEALRETLRARLAGDGRVSLYGQDIEDPKGDVFALTRGLSTQFPGRVRNAPLSEATIVGTAVGRALAGGRPVAFLQFADFLPLAFNQIATELASMHWRTQGGWRAPLILLVSCGGYRPGLGPFHAHTGDALLAHVPGIDVAMPASAAEAAGMLNAAFRSERPTVILYPKALLHARQHLAPRDVLPLFVAPGRARVLREGGDLTLVGWGNTVGLCVRAADALAATGKSAEVIDLRWLAPWDAQAVARSARRTGRLLVVHEDNLRAGFGAEVVAATVEALGGNVVCRRVARDDVFVPCHFGSQMDVLPSYRRTLEAAAAMLGLDLRWLAGPAAAAGRQVVNTLGASPADQTVEVVELTVRVGDRVIAGQTIACLEADKAVVDLASPAEGRVEAMHLRVGDRVAVGTPLMTLKVTRSRQRQPNSEADETPMLTVASAASALPAARPRPAPTTDPASPGRSRPTLPVRVVGLASAPGTAQLGNAELATLLPQLVSEDPSRDGIFERTGIESRVIFATAQTAVSMATAAAVRALAEAGITAANLSLVVCSTSTPSLISPSTACQVLHRLAPGCNVPGYDVLAACSGYLYALAQAWDFLQQEPEAHVLVLTAEAMRSIVDPLDPQTSPIFGDAATATVLTNRACFETTQLGTLKRPFISGHGNPGAALRVPMPHTGEYVHMDGQRIFGEAIRAMTAALSAACERSGLRCTDLDLVVPHQANGRILEAMRKRLGLDESRVWNEIRFRGNTSSSSIPLALDRALRGRNAGARRIGVCAFGAGYTSGAALLECG